MGTYKCTNLWSKVHTTVKAATYKDSHVHVHDEKERFQGCPEKELLHRRQRREQRQEGRSSGFFYFWILRLTLHIWSRLRLCCKLACLCGVPHKQKAIGQKIEIRNTITAKLTSFTLFPPPAIIILPTISFIAREFCNTFRSNCYGFHRVLSR